MLIEAKNLRLAYKDGKETILAVDDISLSLPNKGFFGILGPSGSGKTSLLYLLSGIKSPTSGEINFDQKPFSNISISTKNKIRKESIGFVFQFHFLINYLNVEENIVVGEDTGSGRVNDLIERLGLMGLEKRFPYELSGGQKQRVAIARALANDSKIVFVDEPTASLDHVSADKVVELLYDISKERCVVVVTHDESILKNADQIFKIHDGKLI